MSTTVPERIPMRQINIEVPEAFYDEMQTLVKATPGMTIKKFLMMLIAEELERQGDV